MMARFILRLSSEIMQSMIDHARDSLPIECCGLLIARAGEVESVREVIEQIRLINVLNSPVSYAAEPRELLRIQRQLDLTNRQIVAVYHSHPTSEPIPSQRDLAMNGFGETVMHLIIGLAGPQPILRGWWLSESEFSEGEII